MGLFSSCASKNGGQSSESDSSNQLEQAEAGEEEETESDANVDDQSPGPGANLPHPKKPTAFYTRVFVTTQTQPPVDRISACIEQITSLAVEAENQQALLTAQTQASTLAGADLITYHYCFYQLALKLDERMEIGGPLMDDLATAFFAGIKRLWVLARALDSNTGRNHYMDWLTARYIAMSRQYFGRNIEVLAPPLSHFGSSDFFPSKPAGSAPLP